MRPVEVKAIADAIKQAASISTGSPHGYSLSGKTGSSIASVQPEKLYGPLDIWPTVVIQAELWSDGVCIFDPLEIRTTDHFPHAEAGVSERSWPSLTGIALREGNEKSVIPVQVAGAGLVVYEWDVEDEIEDGDSLGLITSSRRCVRSVGDSRGGTFNVIDIAEHQAEWTDYNFALVFISQRRDADWVTSYDYYDEKMTWQVIEVNGDYTVQEYEPGVIDIEPIE